MSFVVKTVANSGNQFVPFSLLTMPSYLTFLAQQLVIFFSKQLLRHPLAKSNLEEMTEGTFFQRYLPEPYAEELDAPEEIKRHILCTG